MSHQSGSIYKYSGTWYLKYRTFEGGSSSDKRVHKTVTLCAVNGSDTTSSAEAEVSTEARKPSCHCAICS